MQGLDTASRSHSVPPAPVIAIDGPSASGKGTVAQGVAGALGFHYLNSGALYRTVAVAATRARLDLENELGLHDIALNINAKFYGDHVELEGQDVTDAIRTEAISEAASRIAAFPKVRSALLERQRKFRRLPGLVADGRDMGTVVFPDAALKIFLTASPEERAARRYKQLMEKGMSANMAALLQDIRARDGRDSDRAAAPLQKSADAILIDTTRMSVAEAIAQVLALYKQASRAP
ncbi:MAG: (d)CMP kinase [Betaproteobacteria bacterium]|nr:(d)CMP kinase [Betaproteobacteria bacterium]